MGRWINTDGGLLVAISREDVHGWNGYNGHYEEVCGTEGLLSRTTVHCDGHGPFDVLVVGDEPLMATLIHPSNLIVQWMYGDSEEHMLSLMEEDLGERWWEESIEIRANGEFVVFDGTLPGPDLTESDFLSIELSSGRHEVRIGDIYIDARHAVRVAKFASA